MNIAYTASAFYPSIGGAQLHWLEIAKRLQARHHHVAAISQWNDQRNWYLLDSTLFAPLGDDHYVVDGIPVHRYQPSRTARIGMAPLLPLCLPLPEIGYPPLVRYFARRFRAFPEPVDLVHNIRMGREHYSWASFRWAQEKGVPFFITPNYSPRMHTRHGRLLMRNFFRLLRRADGVFVFTPDERDALIGLGLDSSRIHRIGIGPLLAPTWDAESFRKTHRIQRNMVLFLGQKLPYKGFDTLIAAAPHVWQKHPDTSFVFIGPHYGRSRHKILSLQDDRVVDLPAMQPFDPMKAAALAAANIFALPSRQEGIGGVFIEAWKMGKPVIGCRIPFLVIEDGKDGFLVEQQPQPLAERILWLLDHPQEAQRLGEQGRQKVEEHYTWNRITESVESAYASAINVQ